MPVFKLETETAVHYSNVCGILMKILDRSANLKPDLVALDYFLHNGFVPLGKTFSEGIQKINTLGFSQITVDHESAIDLDKLWTLFKTAIVEIFKNNPRISFNLSGGIDTRLIVFALMETGLSPSKIVSIQSPHLEDGRDADVEIPKMICEKLGWGLEIQRPSAQNYSYLRYPEIGEAVLSGLCGGEIYGAQAVNFIPSETKFSLFDAIQIFMNSFRSTFYKSESGSWSSPSNLHHMTTSPFLNRELVSYILSYPEEPLLNYSLYRKHYDLLKARFFDLPLCSGLSYSHPDLALPEDSVILDPKQNMKPRSHSNTSYTIPSFRLLNLAKERIAHAPTTEVKNLQDYCLGLKKNFEIEF